MSKILNSSFIWNSSSTHSSVDLFRERQRNRIKQMQNNGNACNCETCMPFDGTLGRIRMIVCSICGNKRCPHATDHRNACTNSNEPGQPGSSYAHNPFARKEGKS